MAYIDVTTLAHSIFYVRSQELATPAMPHPEPDLTSDAIDALVRFSVHIKLLSAMFPGGQVDARTLLTEIALFQKELSRPGGIFVGDARETAETIVSKLLTYCGWLLDPDRREQWRTLVRNVNPSGADAAVRYYELIRGHWTWCETHENASTHAPSGTAVTE